VAGAKWHSEQRRLKKMTKSGIKRLIKTPKTRSTFLTSRGVLQYHYSTGMTSINVVDSDGTCDMYVIGLALACVAVTVVHHCMGSSFTSKHMAWTTPFKKCA